eukprot:6785157-Pyramimonas_sp.AAC.1
MHQPVPSSHRNRGRMGLAKEEAGGRLGCVRGQWSSQFDSVCDTKTAPYRVSNLAHSPSRGLHH